MIIGLGITFAYIFFLWLFFAKLKVLKISPAWAIVSFWFGVHILLLFLIPPRFYQPASGDARVIRRTIQIVPRLPEPTILTQVLVEPNIPIKKGTPLFQFDKRLYESRVAQAAAELAEQKQNVQVMKATLDMATAQIAEAKSRRDFAQVEVKRFGDLAKQGAGRVEEMQRWQDQLQAAEAGLLVAEANQRKATLSYESKINGVNTSVAQAAAKLAEAQYYLDQTTIVAPEDGIIVNLQAQPGLVVGKFRIGAMASFVCDREPYILATYHQEHLMYVEPGQPVEIVLDTHPGDIFEGTVETVWPATGQGQMMPEGRLPQFTHRQLKGRFAVAIRMKAPLPDLFAGVQGAAAIYTEKGTSFSIIRRVEMRILTFKNFLYPLNL